MNPDHKFARLALPPADLRVESRDGQPFVYDRLRAKWVALTPEEWVRQNFVAWLIDTLGYPASRTANEVSLRLNRTLRRADTVVYDQNARPFMIIEYKRPDVTISQRVFDQIVRYDMVLNARLLVVSNGLTHYCCLIDQQSRSYRFLAAIPHYSEISQNM